MTIIEMIAMIDAEMKKELEALDKDGMKVIDIYNRKTGNDDLFLAKK